MAEEERKQEQGKGLGGSVTIPGTKKKIPVVAIVAVGGAAIAAYILYKSRGTSSSDVSNLPASTDQSGSSTTTDASAALQGEIETMAQELANIEAAMQQPGSAASSSGQPGSSNSGILGSSSGTPAGTLVSDVTTPDTTTNPLWGTTPPAKGTVMPTAKDQSTKDLNGNLVTKPVTKSISPTQTVTYGDLSKIKVTSPVKSSPAPLATPLKPVTVVNPKTQEMARTIKR